ncbi:MobQ family relaxase [Roseomonas mucosa]
MAVYRLSAQIIGRSSGRSATGAAAYRAGMTLTDERTGLVHDYSRKSGVLHSEILAPGDAPDWMLDRTRLWNGVERAEKRKDAQLSREMLLTLPHELDDRQRLELVRGFVEQEFVALGMVADLAIHAPHRDGDDRNHHAHIMLTLRSLAGEGFGNKARDWNTPERLEHWREAWAQHQNQALERAGRTERVDHRSLEDRGLDREPEPKQGPVATKLEQAGKPSKAGDDRRAVQARNAERERLEMRGNVIDLALARQQRGKAAADETRRVQFEKARFETWANGQRAGLQNTRLEAEGALGRTHQAQRRELKELQDKTYGQGHQKAAAALEAITERQARSTGLRGVLYRLSGRSTADNRLAAQLTATIQDIAQRSTEQMGALKVDQAAETRTLGRQSDRAETALERRIAEARDRREAEGWRAMPDRANARAENPSVEAGQGGEGGRTRADPDATHEAAKAQEAANHNEHFNADYWKAWNRIQAEKAARSPDRDRDQDRGGRER